ncbi:hypothetical protein CALCODRAFT_507486 [Calocera cornea HHB12733]|uniref:Rad9-domain-containing protein n=1 Tax=Calocera cornea HHB12733 TaxID=1353952 RepID=A0A165HL91_9BASI|nr:hypothetical protein CALCODRAFT_507486 [Calocera cornea HHB12733]
MEAQLTMASVKTLTKTLMCLSRYSDDMDILALPNSLTLSATNSSKSAYCRLLLQPSFFSSYSVRTPGSSFRSANTQVEEGRSVKARLKTKLLLSYLRHRNHEKGVRSVKLIIREPPQPGSSWAPGTDEDSDDEEGSAESIMLIKFFCDHGVVKQHRLKLEYPDELLAPALEENPHEKVVVASRPALRSLLERMRVAMPKADGQISMEFNPADMVVRTIADKGDINTEVKMIGTDLIRYDTGDTTVSLSFHIREFAATLTLAETLEKYLTLTFTEAPAPLVLAILPTLPDEKEGDDWDFQAFIATSGAADVVRGNGAKRTRGNTDGPRPKAARVAHEDSPDRQGSVHGPPVAEGQWDENLEEQPMGFDEDPNYGAAAAVQSPPPRQMTGASQRPQFQLPRPSQAGPSGTYQATNRASTFRVPSQHPSASMVSRQDASVAQQYASPNRVRNGEPLFLPASQLSPDARREILEETGMDLQNDDLNAFFDAQDDDGDGDEGGNPLQMMAEESRSRLAKVSIAAQSIAFGPTQPVNSSKNSMLDADEPDIRENQEDTSTDGRQFGATQPSGNQKKLSPSRYSMSNSDRLLLQFTPLFKD